MWALANAKKQQGDEGCKKQGGSESLFTLVRVVGWGVSTEGVLVCAGGGVQLGLAVDSGKGQHSRRKRKEERRREDA